MTGTLFVLPVPLADADPRDVLPPSVLTIAREARYLLAENARSARAFLKAAGHPGPIQQVRIIEIGHQPQVSQALEWLAPLRSGQSDAALVSECGCPGIADPGATVVACAHDLGLRVRPLVGPSSLCLALMASGMNGQRFRFHGYLRGTQALWPTACGESNATRWAARRRCSSRHLIGPSACFRQSSRIARTRRDWAWRWTWRGERDHAHPTHWPVARIAAGRAPRAAAAPRGISASLGGSARQGPFESGGGFTRLAPPVNDAVDLPHRHRDQPAAPFAGSPAHAPVAGS